MCLLNIAASAKFSSDRTITDYAREIWHVPCERLLLPPPVFDPNTGDEGFFKRSFRATIDSRFHPVRLAIWTTQFKLKMVLVVRITKCTHHFREN